MSTVREATEFREEASRRRGRLVSFGEPIALRGQELEKVASAPSDDVRRTIQVQFIERLRARDTAAFEQLVEERSHEVFSLLFRLTEDQEEARDLTQETFLRVFQSVERFRGDSDLRTWIYRIAINQARNRWRWWRRRRRDSTISIDAQDERFSQPLAARLESPVANPEETTLSREREAALRRALRTMGSTYREAVILRDMEGLSYDEIATTLDISIGTVKSRLARGRQELRKRLESSL